MPAAETSATAAIITATHHGHGVVTEIAMLATIITTAISAYLLDVSTNSELAALLLPLIGSMLGSVGWFALNPEPETRKIIVGRCIFSLVGGTLSPAIIVYSYSGLTSFFSHAAPMLMAGAVMSGAFYLLSVPVTLRAYKNQKALGNLAVQAAAKALHLDIAAAVARQTENTPSVSVTTINNEAAKP